MAEIFVQILGSQTVSSAFTLIAPCRGISIECPSNGTAASLFVEFSQTSGGPGFSRLNRSDGSGLVYSVHSNVGAGARGFLEYVPTAFGRLALSTAPSVVLSYTITPVLR